MNKVKEYSNIIFYIVAILLMVFAVPPLLSAANWALNFTGLAIIVVTLYTSIIRTISAVTKKTKGE